MSEPGWQTSTKGAAKRVAIWLRDNVGEGGTFTKADLRETFPGVQQIDRRMRDLRKASWVIDDYRVDRSLAPSGEELRLVTIGDAVWAVGYRWPSGGAVSNKQRQAVFAADGYQCVLCGIAGGEPYPDDSLTAAKLTLARQQAPGEDEPMLKTVCERCRAGGGENGTAEQALAEIALLDEAQRERLRRWVAAGQRQPSPEDRAWARYRRLPAEARHQIEQHLDPG